MGKETLKESPNILFIMSDSTRADKLSCYGYHRETTPNIDRLAEEGTRFTNAIPQGVWTLPSHATFFTGLYPSEHGLLYANNSLNVKLNKDLQTLAEYLRAKGYITIGISNNPWVGNLSGMDRGFDFFMESDGTIIDSIGINVEYPFQLKLTKRLGFLTKTFFSKLLIPYLIKRPVFTRFSVELMMNSIEEAIDRREKFFVFVNFMDTHQPYYPPKRNLKQIGARSRFSPYVNYRIHNYYKGKDRGGIKSVLNDYYDGSLNYLDEQLGRLFKMMADRSILDDTLTIFTSDHGKNLGDHSVHDKMASMKDNNLRVPLVIRYPARFPQGKVIDSEVQLVDIYYTIRELVEGNLTKRHENDMSLLDTLKGKKRNYSSVEAVLPFNILQEKAGGQSGRDYIQCVRTSEGKLLKSKNEGLIYYDLVKDPEERNGFRNFDESNVETLRAYLDLQTRIIRGGEKEKLQHTIRGLKRISKV